MDTNKQTGNDGHLPDAALEKATGNKDNIPPVANLVTDSIKNTAATEQTLNEAATEKNDLEPGTKKDD